MTEGDDGDAVLALAQYRGAATLSALSSSEGSALATSELNEDQQFYIKQEVPDGTELVSTMQQEEEPQVIAQLVEASEPAPGGNLFQLVLIFALHLFSFN